MKKSILVVIIIILLIGLGVETYLILTKQKTENVSQDNQNQGVTQNQNVPNQNSAVAQNKNVTIEKEPAPTYKTFPSEGVSFATIAEWVSIDPEELLKTVSPDELRGYQIIYYGISKESIIETASKKSFAKGEKTVSEIFNEDLAATQEQAADYEVTSQNVGKAEARWEATLAFNNQPYTIFSRSILKNIGDKDWYFVLEISVPAALKEKYSEVVNYLLDSLKV